nr:MAG TPA: hypothetical protein [Caudoviricetes sp.]
MRIVKQKISFIHQRQSCWRIFFLQQLSSYRKPQAMLVEE